MNRLILIGNGFDLAHGLKTSYYDFIFSYFKDSFSIARDKGVFQDEFLEIRKTIYANSYRNILDEINDVKGFFQFRNKESTNADLFYFNELGRVKPLPQPKEYEFSIKNWFFDYLATECNNHRWVDIEGEYYKYLKQSLEQKNSAKKESTLIELNDSLCILINKLENYLLLQKPVRLVNEYKGIFYEEINKSEIVLSKIADKITPSRTMFLNFNYTNTLSSYLVKDIFDNFIDDRILVNNIHGEVNNGKNPLIFGFGDELDIDYPKIESDPIKGFLKFIKSFWYFKNTNYHELIRFIESYDFQVFILGHSCGLSDRTMLNMIFEHSNCKSIKIFYHENYGKNNFTDLTEEISRHFKNKGEMRKKIVSFSESKPMPQVISSVPSLQP